VVIRALFIWINHEVPAKLHKDIRHGNCNRTMSESICKYPTLNIVYLYVWGNH
jgi:hypothetical protein